MYNKLKLEVLEIIEIVNKCPESLQEKCFEVLLQKFIASNEEIKDSSYAHTDMIEAEDKREASKSTVNLEIEAGDEEIALKDFHIKIRKFLEINSIGIDTINQLYYKDNEKLMPLYESLKSTKMAESQLRLELLTAFEKSFINANGEMLFNGEEVRQRCQDMKCYDSANFSTNFKKTSSMYDNWNEKYDRKTDYILSAEAKKELAKVIFELVKGE